MSNCELCGFNPAVFEAEIEGTTMKVCTECARFGKVKGKSNVKIILEEKKKIEYKDPEYQFVTGFGSLVKNAREKLGLKQEEMAKKLNERESLLHQIESEHIKPRIDTAKKIEKVLHIHIVDEIKENPDNDIQKNIPPTKTGAMTLGDMMEKNR